MKCNQTQIANLLNIPSWVSAHAYDHRDGWTTFAQSPIPRYLTVIYTVSDWSQLVDEWIQCTYRKTREQFNSAGQADNNDTTTIFGTQLTQGLQNRLYGRYSVSTPEEIDTFGLEGLFKHELERLLGVDLRVRHGAAPAYHTVVNQPRSNVALFGN